MHKNITKLSLLKQISVGCVLVISCALSSFVYISSAQAELFNGPLDRLTGIERDSLRKGKVIVAGEDGKYVARVLITASPSTVWHVLTDYEKLPDFIPNMMSSKVLERNGDRKVVEQVDSRQMFLINVRSRTKIAITETNQKQIDFRLIDGDLASLSGSWKIESIAPLPGKPATQVLVTQTVEAQANAGVPQDTFYGIFKDSLSANLAAVSNEAIRRARL